MLDIEFNQVSKKYLIRKPSANGRRSRWQKFLSRRTDFWALRNVNFVVERGEALGIIGHNGAGKSTILKLLSSITAPTSGEIVIDGRLAALIEIGSGFHPELTGRENVFLNGVLLGMRRREIAAKLDSIVEFAGVEQFIDTPVKYYSSGMYLRLGFSIAAHLDPEILLLDEVLAVGDAAFQAKCLDRVTELKRAGTTIVFISHNLHAVSRLCERTLLLSRGEVLKDGPTNDVIAEYERILFHLAPSAPHGDPVIPKPQAAQVVSLGFYDSSNLKTNSFRTGESLRAVVEYEVSKPLEDAVIEIYFYSIFGNLHCHLSTSTDGERLSLTPGKGAVEFFCPEVALEAATFNVDVGIKCRGSRPFEFVDCKRAAVLNVVIGKPVMGSFYMPHSWKRGPSQSAMVDSASARDHNLAPPELIGQ
jgi:ABC-type polysaccharide/polyol phosphate transport system, ATPase component